MGGARYLLKRLLGRGDWTAVWLARDVKLEREVALKILPDFLLGDANAIERLKNETTKLAELSHPNIARTLDFVRDHSATAIAVEYVEGWSLAALRVDKPEKRYRVADITPWIRQLCAALDHAHNGGFIHGNLKSSDLMLDQREQLKLIGFGIDRSLRAIAGQTEMSRVAATLGFMSPQQALGEPPTVLDDVYSLGATIYDLLTGTPPFYKGQILAQVCERKAQSMTDRLRESGSEESVSAVVEDTVAMCLEKEPAKRPPNAAAVLRLLERSDVPVSVTEVVEEGKKAAVEETESRFEDEDEHEEEDDQAKPEPQGELKEKEEAGAEQVAKADPPSLGYGAAGEAEAEQKESPANRNKSYLVGVIGCVGVLVIAVLLWGGHRGGKAARAGGVNAGFVAPTNADHEIRAAVVQSDKKIIVGGMFTRFGDGAHRSLARLNPDGTMDDSFTGTTGGDVHAIALQPDGQIIIAGEFGKVNDSTRRRIARLNPDGSLDESFRATAGANRDIRTVLVQPDGKILLGGGFDISSGKKVNRIVRFNPDGTRDNTFDVGAGAPAIVWSLALQRDGKIVAGGDFTVFNNRSYCRIVRLNSNGSVDDSFEAGGGANGQVFAIAVQNDGKILVGGDFVRVNQVERNHIARLKADGSVDMSFDPGAGPNSGVRCLAIQPDGKILIGGIFTSVQGAPRSRIARLKADGTVDTDFDPGAGADEVVRWVGTEENGAILIAGGFTKCDGVERMRIARLKGG